MSSFRELAAYAARKRLRLKLRTNAGSSGDTGHRITELECGNLERYIAKPGGTAELDAAAAELLKALRAME